MSKKLFLVYSISDSLVFLDGQVGYLSKQGYDIAVITSPSERLNSFANKYGISYFGILMERKIAPFKDLVSIIMLYKLFRIHRPDIVHGNTPKGGLLSMIASWLARVPIRIYSIHGFPFETATGFQRLILKRTERISCLLATNVLSVSPSLRDTAITNKIVKATKIQVLANGSCNGVDTEVRFNPEKQSQLDRMALKAELKVANDTMIIGFVGRLVRDKGIYELFEAWEKIQTQFKNVHLLVIGHFDTRDNISSEHINELKLDKRITFISKTDTIERYYAVMNLFILPTYREGFPTVLLEASSMSLPTIATNTTGCKDAVVDGKTGILVPPYNSNALYEAIKGLLIDNDLREMHGNNGRKYVLDNFTNKIVWTAIDRFYKKLLN